MMLPILFSAFIDGAIFGSYATAVGPQNPENKVFSTNWLAIGGERDFSSRGALFARGRFSLEPLTIPAGGYPQLFQVAGGLVDHMRAHDLVEEVAFGVEWRPLQLYLAPVGEPPLGAEPYAQRRSSIDFAEAPFAYDAQESFHVATRIAAVAATSKIAAIEYGVFHASQTTGRHASIDDGNIDSWSARLTIAPQSRVSLQASTGRLTSAHRKVDSASLSYNGQMFFSSAIYTKNGNDQSYGLELELELGRGTLLGRAEHVRNRTHTTLGYIFDVIRLPRHRAGIGVNVDYHGDTSALSDVYGHKPQTIYLFMRWRTDREAPTR